MTSIPTTRLPSGEAVPILGQGTWCLADDPRRRREEIATLQLGIDLGMTLIDAAEMYGDGASEELVGEAIQGRREGLFLVSKVLPGNATRHGTVAACERSLKRLGTDRLDLYLLHWRGGPALAETLEGFADLQRAGKIRHWGVSNLDIEDCRELAALPDAKGLATNQLLYNLTRRGIEFDLLPWCRERRVPVMAYSPIEQGRLLRHPALPSIADRHGATPAQIALAWLLRQGDIIAIPKAGHASHVRDNHGALSITLDAADLAALDSVFPPPNRARPLEML
ncbi:MAG: aldo/keto reductase [Alphaproteobacteria bacterium]|nr:aldo/keto reductase [Alphaproteobacteria bacterium]MBU0796868.1 aldo/keto reductase [Alphaproteobacteria bacterium]MBU0889115.1 aldo/keto reductase [Alphaproteobacteria bacterium]MBU1812149.1 aldo/keto reductase [Alphaproteobacteria bacterium]